MRLAVSFASALVFLATSQAARAQSAATDDAMGEALKAFDAAEAELASGTPCTTMCKALQSMMGAADRICALAKDGSEIDHKRCADARAKVAEAIAAVRKSCPDCNPAPPYAPSATSQPAAAPGDAVKEESVLARRGAGVARATTITIDPLALFLPGWVVQVRVERALAKRTSLAITAGAGSLPTVRFVGVGPSERASVGVVGVELRQYLVGRSDRFGLFVSADVTTRSSSAEAGTKLDARGFVPGTVVAPVAGVKLVTESGLAIESRVGIGFVARDERPEGTPRDKVVPIGTVGLGWTF